MPPSLYYADAWAAYFADHPKVRANWGHQNGYAPPPGYEHLYPKRATDPTEENIMKNRHIIVVMDRSGSMMKVRSDTEGGLKSFLAEQDKDVPTTVTLNQFDDGYETVYADVPLADVPDYHLTPRGSTALRDAICRSILGAADKPDTDTVLVVLTDGEENASREHTMVDVNRLIAEKREQGWVVVFLGADQDAIAVGTSMGVSADTSLSYASANTSASLANAGRMVTRGMATGSYEFTDEERRDARQ